MEVTQNEYNKSYKILIRRYLIAMIIFIILFVSRQVIIQYQINHEKDMSNVINIAGRQRMLSQRLIKNMNLVIRMGNNEQEVLLDDINIVIEMLKDSHQDLIEGNEERGLPGHNSEEVRRLFIDIEPDIIYMIDSANYFIVLINEGNADEEELYEIIIEANVHAQSFLNQMDKIVSRYEMEINGAVDLIEKTEWILFLMIILSLTFITIFVFLPVEKTLKKAFWEVNETNENIIKLFKTMKGAIFLIDYDGEILLMNSDAEKLGVFSSNENKTHNIKNDINWKTDETAEQIINIIKENGSVDEIELELEDKAGIRHIIMLSAVKGNFKGKRTILISMFDNTKQKIAEETLKNVAIRDELTGLYNRRFLYMIVEEEVEKAERFDTPLSAFMLDLDHFKKINDKWGHPVGDTVLKMTAEILINTIRMSDFAVRIGGEEFIVLMPNTNIEGAKVAAEKVRKAIESSIHPLVGKYTASFGVAERLKGETFIEVYNRIDDAMYEAKRAGRNRVVVSSADHLSHLSHNS